MQAGDRMPVTVSHDHGRSPIQALAASGAGGCAGRIRPCSSGATVHDSGPGAAVVGGDATRNAAVWGGLAVLTSHRWLLALHPLTWMGVPAVLSLPIAIAIWGVCGQGGPPARCLVDAGPLGPCPTGVALVAGQCALLSLVWGVGEWLLEACRCSGSALAALHSAGPASGRPVALDRQRRSGGAAAASGLESVVGDPSTGPRRGSLAGHACFDPCVGLVVAHTCAAIGSGPSGPGNRPCPRGKVRPSVDGNSPGNWLMPLIRLRHWGWRLLWRRRVLPSSWRAPQEGLHCRCCPVDPLGPWPAAQHLFWSSPRHHSPRSCWINPSGSAGGMAATVAAGIRSRVVGGWWT